MHRYWFIDPVTVCYTKREILLTWIVNWEGLWRKAVGKQNTLEQENQLTLKWRNNYRTCHKSHNIFHCSLFYHGSTSFCLSIYNVYSFIYRKKLLFVHSEGKYKKENVIFWFFVLVYHWNVFTTLEKIVFRFPLILFNWYSFL